MKRRPHPLSPRSASIRRDGGGPRKHRANTEYLADAVRVVRASGLPNRTDAMFTSIEGDGDEVMAVVKDAVDAVAPRAPRVSLTLKQTFGPA